MHLSLCNSQLIYHTNISYITIIYCIVLCCIRYHILLQDLKPISHVPVGIPHGLDRVSSDLDLALSVFEAVV